MKTRPDAFSLIELLVVIAIVAVIIGILLPVLPAVRDSALRTACGANLRTIGQSLELYKQRSNDVFPEARYMPPPFLSGDDHPPFNEVLSVEIEPESESYRCPGDPDLVWAATAVGDDGVERRADMSYTYVTVLSGRPYEQTFFATFLRRSPSDTPVSYDFDGGTFELQDGGFLTADFFHRTRNVVFVDGHVGAYADEGTAPSGPAPPPGAPGATAAGTASRGAPRTGDAR